MSATRPRPKQCEICERPEVDKRLCLDHCHESGVFRGWICDNCNLGLGLLGDNVLSVQRALMYLQIARCQADAYFAPHNKKRAIKVKAWLRTYPMRGAARMR